MRKTREHKYPETTTFRYYNANPKNRITGDCVIRAISRATGIPYNAVVMDLAELQCKTGYDDGMPQCYGKYLESKGFVKHKQPRKFDNTKFTGKDFCKNLMCCYENLPIVAHIGGHHVICIDEVKDDDGIYRIKVLDIWDSTDGCIGNYWTKG